MAFVTRIRVGITGVGLGVYFISSAARLGADESYAVAIGKKPQSASIAEVGLGKAIGRGITSRIAQARDIFHK